MSTRSARTTPKDDSQARGRDREVLDTAAEIFARKGYSASTVQDVADALGILKGSLYYYIKTKEDLLFRLLEEIHDDVDELLREIDDADRDDALETLREYVRVQTTYNLKSLTKISVYYNDLEQLSGDRLKEIVRRRKVHEDFVRGLIVAGQEQGRIAADRDPHTLANCVFANVIWPYRWYRPRGRQKLEDVVEACVDFVTYGLAGAR